MPANRQEVIEKVTTYVARVFGDTSLASFAAAFIAHDGDNDSRLSLDEVSEILSKAGVGFRLTRWAVAKEIIDALDTDGDGFVEFAEFSAVFKVTRPITLKVTTMAITAALPPTTAMVSVELSFIDVQGVGEHIVHLLHERGNLALGIVTTFMKMVKSVTLKDYLTVFTLLNAEIADITALIAAVKDEFGL